MSPGMARPHEIGEADATLFTVGKRCTPPGWRGERRRYKSEPLAGRPSINGLLSLRGRPGYELQPVTTKCIYLYDRKARFVMTA